MIAPRGETLADLDARAFEAQKPLKIVTADCSNPHEIDDGLAVEALPTLKTMRELYRVHVAVVDGSPIYRNSGLLNEAIRSTQSEYYVDENGQEHYVPMLPLNRIRSAELRRGEVRSVLDVSFVVGNRQAPTDLEVRFRKAKTVENYDYVKFGNKCHSDPDFRPISRAAQILVKHLGEGITIADGQDQDLVDALKDKKWRRGAQINSIFMVGVGHLVSAWMAEDGHPFINRIHDPAEAPHTAFLDPDEAFYSRTPGRHEGLGLEPYARVTSPLRRVEDMINHGLIKARLDGRSLTDHENRQIDVAIRNLNRREVMQTRSKRKQHAAREFWAMTGSGRHALRPPQPEQPTEQLADIA